MTFQSMRNILSRSLGTAQVSQDLTIAGIFEASRSVLAACWGEERGACLKPVSFNEGCLKFQTDSPAAKQQMTLEQARIKNEINRKLGRLEVKKIIVETKGF